jgi:hypothetical protein
MPNKRYQDMLDEGERQRAKQRALERHPLTPQDAARILCLVHTASDGGPITGVIPDFTNLDGDLYRAAWLTLRRFAEIDSNS